MTTFPEITTDTSHNLAEYNSKIINDIWQR